MMEDLALTIIQTDLFWEERRKNLDHVNDLISRIHGKTDLILLPETFNTGFSMHPNECAEEMNGPSMQFLHKISGEKGSAIMTTLLIREEGKFVNRLICQHPDGRYDTYDKRHLFRLSEEPKILRRGEEKTVIHLKGWKISPMICYDLRFPVWSKNTLENDQYAFDLLVYVANWPNMRAYAWKSLLIARAIENISYVAGVNRIGKDGNGMDHTGDSMVVDHEGGILFQAEPDTEVSQTVTLSGQELTHFRESTAFGQDWDKFSLH